MAQSAEKLTMVDATFARNKGKQSELKSEFKSKLDKLIKEIKNYDTIVNQVNTYWVGDDAAQFKTVIKANATSLSSLLNKLKSQFDKALSTDQKAFAKTQTSNVSIVKSSKIKF